MTEEKKVELVRIGFDKNEEKKRLACALYCAGMDKAEIARRVEVDRKTIGVWSTRQKWELKRQEWLALRDTAFCAQAGLPAEQALATINNCRALTDILTKEIEEQKAKGQLYKIRELVTCLRDTHNMSMQAYRDMGIDVRLKLRVPDNIQMDSP